MCLPLARALTHEPVLLCARGGHTCVYLAVRRIRLQEEIVTMVSMFIQVLSSFQLIPPKVRAVACP